MRKHRLLACMMAVIMAVSLIPSTAWAAEEKTLQDAQNSLAQVEIAQTYNGSRNNDVSHNYANSDKVELTYQAKLYMTDTMAIYLSARQKQLMDANFVIHMNVDLDKLQFAGNSDTVTFTFKSTFLKVLPPQSGNTTKYDATYAGHATENGYTFYNYTITANVNDLLGKTGFDVNAALITYTPVSKEVATQSLSGEPLTLAEAKEASSEVSSAVSLSSQMTKESWMQPITLELATLVPTADTVKKVKDKRETVTVTASGTITGSFSYATHITINTISDLIASAANTDYYKTLVFGDDNEIKGWTSNEVKAKLYYRSGGGGGGGYTPPPLLNTEDHFGYIIGYPVDYYTGEKTDDQTRMPVKPQGQITRAEVATIFFRMLTDTARTQYWSQTSSYTDVDADDWFNNAICTLSNAGIISGYPDGSFQPNGKITRAEFATIASRFFDVEADGRDIFPDIDGHWAEQYINEAATAGIITGYEDGTFRPQKLITRAEAVTMVNRTLGRAPDLDHFLSDMLVWPDNMDTSKWYYAQVQEATNSHEYEMKTKADGTKYEVWTKMLPMRDWQAFEKEWSDSNSSENPGDVV